MFLIGLWYDATKSRIIPQSLSRQNDSFHESAGIHLCVFGYVGVQFAKVFDGGFSPDDLHSRTKSFLTSS